MTDRRAAIEAFKEFKERLDGRYKIDRGVRHAITGDGRGTGSANYYYEGDLTRIWAREYGKEDSPFPVVNRNRVRAAINLPIIIGYDDTDSTNEQVIGVNYAGIPADGSAGGIIGDPSLAIGNHHTQHEWGGGDEVYIDGRQFLNGLIHETTPATMQVIVKPFVYYYGGSFARYAGGSSVDFSSYKPSGSVYRYLAITFDQSTGSLAYDYRQSDSNEGGAYLELIEGISASTAFDLVPSLQDNHLPLGAVYLTSATSIVSRVDPVNLFDLRLHLSGKSSGGTEATAIGQIQISLDGQSFSARIPLTDKHAGLLFDSQSGYMIVA